MDIQSAADVYAALCNIDVYTTLTTERGWPPDRIEQWWAGALTRELLAEQTERPVARQPPGSGRRAILGP
jgi:hypothetical protein